jgi:hypothetical protein
MYVHSHVSYCLPNLPEQFCGYIHDHVNPFTYNMLLCLHTFLVREDHAMAHALSSWFLTAEDQVQYRGSSPSGLSDKVALGQGLLKVLQLPLVIIIPAIFTFHSPTTDPTYNFSK